jgi:hypothetical protein
LGIVLLVTDSAQPPYFSAVRGLAVLHGTPEGVADGLWSIANGEGKVVLG